MERLDAPGRLIPEDLANFVALGWRLAAQMIGIAESVDAIARASENVDRATRQVREASRGIA